MCAATKDAEPSRGRGYEGATIAHLWDYPTLCVGIFGMQIHTPEGQRRIEASGIDEEMIGALDAATSTGFLHQEEWTTADGALLIQYWRSYDEMDRWARTLPHMRWWRWLVENAGENISFWHEIYQVKTAEAIFEEGCHPVGPARFAATTRVTAGGGQGRQRQERFAEAAASIR